MDAKARFHPRVKEKQKSRNHCGYGIFVELLSRFELETSSLPTNKKLLLLVVVYSVLSHSIHCAAILSATSSRSLPLPIVA